MSNFEDIIKQKTEQFDVPYNEAHWQKVEQQLNAIKIARIKKNVFIAAGVVAIVSVFSVWMYQNSNNSKTNPTTQIPIHEKHYSATETNKPSIIHNNTNESKNIDHSLTQNTPQVNHGISYQHNNSIEKVNSITPDNEELITENNAPNPIQPNNVTNKAETETIKLTAEFIVYNNKVCLGEQVSFEAIEKKNVSYLWDFGDGTTSTKQNPEHNYLSAGNYNVKLTIADIATGKKVSHEVKSAASILPLPATDFTYTEQAEKFDANKLKYPYTVFSTKGDETNSYFWQFGNGQTSKSATPKIIYHEKGLFKTSLTVTNSFGCTQTTSKSVSINHPFTLFAPNAFSPNLDGDNDIFIPKGLLTWDVQFEMIIKNKSGDIIYKTTDKNAGWNGKHNNTGVVLDPGIYFWQVITYDAEGTPHQHVGKINLIK